VGLVIVEHLSASRIGTFEQCQLKYHAIYEEKLEEGPPHPLTVMGKAVHKAAELGVAMVMAGQAVYWDALVRQACASMGVSRPNCELAKELMANAVKWGYLRNVEYCAGLEIEFFEELTDGTKVKGIIDRLDRCPRFADVIDVKTQQRAFDEARLHLEWQSVTYNWAVRRKWPEITGDVRVSYWTLRHRVQRCVLAADDARRGEDILMRKAEEIRSCDDPKPSPSPLCQWCPKSDCRARGEGVKERFKRRFK
jgi:RecB family exonuclease